jgi:simple sugar transport system substrate-binding protein
MDMGVNLRLERLEPQPSVDVLFSKMAEQIEAYCNEGVDGIFVSIPSDVIVPAVQVCLDLGIPVVNINAGVDAAAKLGVLNHVGQLEYNSGYSAGMRLVEAGMQEGFCLSHVVGVSTLAERCQGFADALAEKEILYSGEHEVPADSDSAYVDSVLKIVGKDRTWENVGLLLLGLPQLAPGLLVKKEKPEVLLGAFDVSDELYAALDEGTILFGIDQNPYLQGYFPIPLLTYQITSEQSLQNRVIESGPAFVTTSPSADQKVCETNMFKTCEELPGSGGKDPDEPDAQNASSHDDDDDDNHTAVIASSVAVGATFLLLAAYFVCRSKGSAAANTPDHDAETPANADQEQPLEKPADAPAENSGEALAAAPVVTSTPSKGNGE